MPRALAETVALLLLAATLALPLAGFGLASPAVEAAQDADLLVWPEPAPPVGSMPP